MDAVNKFIRNILIVWLLSLLLPSCSNNDFSDALTKAVGEGADTNVVFRDLTSFEWDKVYVYGPYQSLVEINKKHGTTLEANSSYASEWVPEGDCLYIFTLDGKPVHNTFHPRFRGSCVDILDPGIYSKEEAVFKVEIKVVGAHPTLQWVRSKHSLQPQGEQTH